MTDNEALTPGGRANLDFVSSKKAEDKEREDKDKLAGLIPKGSLDCSAAWRETLAGRGEKIKDCPGRTEQLIGEKVVGQCHLGQVAASEESLTA